LLKRTAYRTAIIYLKTIDMIQNVIPDFAKSLKANEQLFLNCQAAIALQFSLECQRFRMIKNSTVLTTTELETISMNAAKNYLNSIAVNELPVTFQIVNAA